MLQQVAVLLDVRAAAGGGHDDGFDRGDAAAIGRRDMRPPGVDVAAHVVERLCLRVEVEAQRAAATGLRRLEQGDAERIEQARGGGVGVRRQPRLHAAASASMRRGCADFPASRATGRRRASAPCRPAPAGRNGRIIWPRATAGRKIHGRSKASFSAARTSRWPSGRGTFASTTLRPMSSRRWYLTPEGQVVSHERQERQRSRCSCVSRSPARLRASA